MLTLSYRSVSNTMGETANGRTGVSFTTEFVSIMLMYVMLCVCHGGRFVFQATGRHVVLYGLQSLRSDVTNVYTKHTPCRSNIHYRGIARK